MQARELQRPLEEAELDDLRRFLETTSGAMKFSEAHGFLTAIASAPTTMLPSVWIPQLFGEDEAYSSMEQVNHVFGLVMRLYNEIVEALAARHPIAPSDADEDVEGWCAGYLRAARMDEVWTADEVACVLLLPVAVLAGDFDLVGETDADGKVIEDASGHMQRYRESLDNTVHEANQHWTKWRHARGSVRVASRPPKIGRNEPCPCGSGRKYKKCCALEA